MTKKPKVQCPACLEIYHKSMTDEYVVVCGIIYEQFEQGQSNYENYTVVPSHCLRYDRCPLWRESKEKDWERKIGEKYSSLQQAETIRV